MSQVLISELSEINSSQLTGYEHFLINDGDSTKKVVFNTLYNFINDKLDISNDDLTNKILDDVSNLVHANAIHFKATTTDDISMGQPLKLVVSTNAEIVYVKIAVKGEDIIGVAEHDYVSGDTIEVIHSGMISGIDTSAWEEGTNIYMVGGILSDVNNTNDAPKVGKVINSDVNSGMILINASIDGNLAKNIDYTGVNSGLSSTDTQDAIDELKALDDLKLIAGENLGDLIDIGIARLNLSVYSKSEIDANLNNRDTNNRNRDNHTGTQSLDTITETANKKIFTDVERTKLNNVPDDTNQSFSDILTTISSNDSDLDTTQEIVDYIKATRNTSDNLTLDNITNGEINKHYTNTEKIKVSNISISQPVDLDAIEIDTNLNNAHKISTGEDHTFINQDMKDTADVTFNSVNGRSVNVDGDKLDLIEDGATNNTVSNVLDNTSVTDALSANQGKMLKDYIDNINTLLSSDDTTLDELQEIVDFIKLNKDDLDALGISNIAGLQNALDLKLTANGVIVAGTGTKVTYDENGLVTSSTDADTSDIADTLDKRYSTDLEKTNFNTAYSHSQDAHAIVDATKNITDAELLDRANHTGTQLADTISDFDAEVSNNSEVQANTAKVTNYNQTKTDIDLLGINSSTVNELTVETAVPENAIFTDTDSGSGISLDTTNFDLNLSSDDDDVQKAMKTLNDLVFSSVSSLVDLTDTEINTPLDEQVLSFDSASGKWINSQSTSASSGGSIEYKTFLATDDQTVFNTEFEIASRPMVFIDGGLEDDDKYTWNSSSVTFNLGVALNTSVVISAGISTTAEVIQKKDFYCTEDTTEFTVPFNLVSPTLFIDGSMQSKYLYSFDGKILTLSSGSVPAETFVSISNGGLTGAVAGTEENYLTREFSEGDYNININDYVFTDTTGGSFNMLLPDTASLGDKVTIFDSKEMFSTNNLIAQRNGNLIMGLDEDLTLSIDNKKTTLIYSGNDWRIE